MAFSTGPATVRVEDRLSRLVNAVIACEQAAQHGLALRIIQEDRRLVAGAHVGEHRTDHGADRAGDAGVQRRVLPQDGGEERGAGARQAGNEVDSLQRLRS